MSNTTTEPGRRTGLFVVFEGVEGAGKSTHIRRVADRLARMDAAFRLVREPGATEVGERVRALVLDPGLDMAPETELLLVVAARAEFVRRVVRPALAAGELVLSDRYELSTLAYQGAGREIGIERAREWSRLATEGLAPDLTILLMVAPEVGRGRQSGAADRMERERPAFHRVVAGAYRRLAAADDRVVIVETDADPDVVHERIWAELSSRWPGRFPPGAREPGNFSAPTEFHEQEAASGGPQNDGEESE